MTDAIANLRPAFERRIAEAPVDLSLGYDLRAGLDVPISGTTSIFAEYRYTDFKGHFTDGNGRSLLYIDRLRQSFDQRFRTQHFLIGISIAL